MIVNAINNYNGTTKKSNYCKVEKIRKLEICSKRSTRQCDYPSSHVRGILEALYQSVSKGQNFWSE